MVKKEIKSTNFITDEEIVRVYYFHLSKSDLAEMEILSEKESFKEYLTRICESEDNNEILTTFKKILLSGYGTVTEDGVSFIKNKKETEKFEGSDAFSELLFEMYTRPDFAAEFCTKMLPKGVANMEKENLETNGPVTTFPNV